MRSRTLREGSVGLLILAGLLVFGGLVLWIRGLAIGNRSYKFVASFGNVAGMKEGAAVRYRGVDVGQIKAIQAQTNGVAATIEIEPADLLIPRDALIEANQSGLVGETTIDITPVKPLPANALSFNPLDSQCNSKLVICDEDRVEGRIGVSFIELLRGGTRLTELYTSPEFYNNVNTLTRNASTAATSVAQLSGELSLLSRSVRQEIGNFSEAANSVTTAANRTTTQFGVAANRISITADKAGATLDKAGATLDKAGATFDKAGTTVQRVGNTADRTAIQLNQLLSSTNSLIGTNRSKLVRTLDNVSQASEQLGGLLGRVTSTVDQVNSTVGNLNTTAGRIDVEGLLGNLQTLSANAAEASANLRDISTALNSPENVLVLQQTLDSARATFENTQKITADLDELTGDPAFRNNLRDLVNGLGNLVSSTEQLEQQVQVARELESIKSQINATQSNSAAGLLATPPLSPNSEIAKTNPPENGWQLLKQLPSAQKESSAGNTSEPAIEPKR